MDEFSLGTIEEMCKMKFTIKKNTTVLELLEAVKQHCKENKIREAIPIYVFDKEEKESKIVIKLDGYTSQKNTLSKSVLMLKGLEENQEAYFVHKDFAEKVYTLLVKDFKENKR